MRPAPIKPEGVEPRMDQAAEQSAEQHQAAGGDHHLTVDLNRLAPIGDNRKAGLFTRIDAAGQQIGFAGRLVLKPGGIISRALAGPAMEDDGAGRAAELAERLHGDIAGTLNALACVLIRFADVRVAPCAMRRAACDGEIAGRLIVVFL
jgi:hypothetical protein